MKANHQSKLDDFLAWLIVDATDEEVRGVASRTFDLEIVTALQELSELNDLAWPLFAKMNNAGAAYASHFKPSPDNGGIIGFRNADAEALRLESRQIVSALAGDGCDCCLAKGATVEELYPANSYRHQNDFDIVTRSQGDLLKLLSFMFERGYSPRVLAVRLTERNTMEGALSVVRVERDKKLTLWSDIWLAVQPLGGGSARRLPPSFWSNLIQLGGGGVGPKISDRLVLLINEVEERGLLRLRDLLDFVFLSRGGQQATADADFNRDLQAVIVDAASQLSSFLGSCGQFTDRLQQVSAQGGLATKYPLDISDVGKGSKPPLDTLVRFGVVSNARGELAVDEYGGRTILRSPFGTFASEQPDRVSRERLFGV